ncbi:MAG TPA: hypothetical protein VNB06_19510 [Thermoanaerobaculia bacterium]|nr:hypothetical protein [Thermoanaerobaculia bacterium]
MKSPPRSSPRRRPRYGLLAAGAVTLLLVSGHVAFWYLPRWRPVPLDPRTPAGATWASAPGIRLWLPFPHQSPLAAAGLDAIEAAAGALPRFGPLRVPPARELALARSAESTTVVVAVYPVWAMVGRLAGALSGNPWLRTGRFQHRGDWVEVSWRGTTWVVVVGKAPGRRDVDPSQPRSEAADRTAGTPLVAALALDRESLAGLALPRALDGAAAWGLLLPEPGRARLVALRDEESGLVFDDRLEASEASHLAACTDEDGSHLVAACWYENRVASRSGRDDGGELSWSTTTGLLLLAPSVPAEPGVWRLPSAASLERPLHGEAGMRPVLPVEALARRLDATLLSETHAGWEITAFDEPALQAGRRLAESWAATRSPLADGGDLTNATVFSSWVRPAALRRIAEEVAGALENLPLVDPGEARRWSLAAGVLARVESLEHVIVLGGDEGMVVRWRQSDAAKPPP